MNPKRPYQDDTSHTRESKWPRTFDIGLRGSNLDKGHNRHMYPATQREYTIAWICALPLELAASRAMLDEEHQTVPIDFSDDNAYVLGHIDRHNIVMACLPCQYGTNSAAVVATNLKRSFPSIRATLMVGIGGGSPSMADLYLGDVVVGTRVMQYDMRKVIAGGQFQMTADAKIPAPRLLSAVSDLQARHRLRADGVKPTSSSRVTFLLQSRLPKHTRPAEPDRLFQVAYEHPPGATSCRGCDLGRLQVRGARPSVEPKIHYGVIASANSVMKCGKTRDDIARQLSAVCFEMEAAGLMDNLQCLPIRGICDYSDSHKTKEWQDYAAATAAAYARELVEGLPLWVEGNGQLTSHLGSMARSEPTGNDSRTVHAKLHANYDCDTDDQAANRRQNLLKSLEFDGIDARKTTIRAAHSKTCSWFLQHPAYVAWLDPAMQSHNHGFLWMRGKAGAGKSTMMKFLYLQTKRKLNGPSTSIASFFFNARGGYLERSVTGMYRSLLMQLLEKFPDLQSVLDDTDIIPSSQQDCPDLNPLQELLRSAILALGQQRSLTCFIDALDECDELEVRNMVQYFEELAATTTEGGVQLRICFSSRPYPYIDVRQGATFTLEDESGHADDLAQYVKVHLRITSPLLLADLQSEILAKAAGIFMWIVLVVDILNSESSHGALALRKRISELPNKLSDLFRRILTRDQERTEHLLLCVLWILCAKRPLTPAEFRHAIWAGLLEKNLVDPDLPDDTELDAIKLVTSSSKGLAEITKAQQPTVQFIHESVRDFLLKDKGLQDLWPEVGFEWEGPAQERLKNCCATYLRLPGVRTMVNRSESGVEALHAIKTPFSFLEYASQQILFHADAAAPVFPQDDFLSDFFASTGIKVINCYERFRSRQYGSQATALYILAEKGLGNLIRVQMKTASPVYVPEERYEYPLFAALANGQKGAAAALLCLPSITCDGVDIAEGFRYKKDLRKYQGRTPLSWATQEGRLGIAESLIEAGANLEETDQIGQTPLLLAFKLRRETIAQLLIDKGANVNIQDQSGQTALIWASQAGGVDAVRLLIDKGASVNIQDQSGQTALIRASKTGRKTVARLLIDKGANINIQDQSGQTALIWASQAGSGDTARLLIDKGANINTQCDEGETALIWALRTGRKSIARLLIDEGVDVHAQNKKGKTALMLALHRGYKTTAQLLIDKGASIDA